MGQQSPVQNKNRKRVQSPNGARIVNQIESAASSDDEEDEEEEDAFAVADTDDEEWDEPEAEADEGCLRRLRNGDSRALDGLVPQGARLFKVVSDGELIAVAEAARRRHGEDSFPAPPCIRRAPC